MIGLLKTIAKLFAPRRRRQLTVDDLAQRLGVTVRDLHAVQCRYRTFTIPKRTGGVRQIAAPAPELKAMQRRILRKLLATLRVHPSAVGFERNQSIVANACPHVGREVVIKFDIKDFFPSISADRARKYFRTIGWKSEAAEWLTRICTHDGALPQGAPTSPRLSNLINHKLDARLAALAERAKYHYTRYADDLTFSGPASEVGSINNSVKQIVQEEGYTLHTQKKLRIARRHDRQVVTGLVVNDKVNVPRSMRRKLRSAEHYLRTGKAASFTPEQIRGWHALLQMVQTQR